MLVIYNAKYLNDLACIMTVFITQIGTKCLFLSFAVIANGLDFERLHFDTFGYPKDLACQYYIDGLLRGQLECAIQCLRSECIAWTLATPKSCVVCGRCVSDGDALASNATDVYRSLQVKTEGKLISQNYNGVRRNLIFKLKNPCYTMSKPIKLWLYIDKINELWHSFFYCTVVLITVTLYTIQGICRLIYF